MAAVPTGANDVGKMSFARVCDPNAMHIVSEKNHMTDGVQVAASAPKGSQSTTVISRIPDPAPASNGRENTGPAPRAPSAAPATTTNTVPPSGPQTVNEDQYPDANLIAGLKDLKLETRTTPNLVVNGSKAGNSQTPSDDTSQRADSSSELGTKPPSLDGKSITSGTTFALDEKESLRPDDSASVKAAAEDDDSFSIRGSYIAGSRMGSDIAARIHRIQIGDMPPRTLPPHHVLTGNKSQGIVTPQSGISDKQTAPDPKVSLVGGAPTPDGLASNAFYSKAPDEKLLEAMQSPKDRIFLLRLEQQVIEFAQNSKYVYIYRPFLPPRIY